MISPAQMKIIQIEVTNACIHHCSNCTRFCGLHETTFMMNMKEFQNAVDSLHDYPGIVGIMGGEPTLNPHFAEMAEYLFHARPEGKKADPIRSPIRNFNEFHQRHWNSLQDARRGLWSALGKRYYENLELISDIFPYQCLNDHKNVGLHQALLLPRKELGIEDKTWFALRDKCWIQNEWSASITPKGAFFCEIAAALDMLFDGPGGWPVEPGWWKRSPQEFGSQLQWCEYCSAALAVPKIPGNLERDILSPGIWEKIRNRKKAWKVANNRCTIFQTSAYQAADYTLNYDGVPYLSAQDVRISQDTGHTLFPNKIAILNRTGKHHAFSFENSRIIREEEALQLQFEDWLLILNAQVPIRTLSFLHDAVFNPGIFYYSPGGELIFFNRKASSLKDKDVLPSLLWKKLRQSFPRRKQYCWKNWQTPETESFQEKWNQRIQALIQRGKDSFRYRSGLLLKRMRRKSR